MLSKSQRNEEISLSAAVDFTSMTSQVPICSDEERHKCHHAHQQYIFSPYTMTEHSSNTHNLLPPPQQIYPFPPNEGSLPEKCPTIPKFKQVIQLCAPNSPSIKKPEIQKKISSSCEDEHTVEFHPYLKTDFFSGDNTVISNISGMKPCSTDLKHFERINTVDCTATWKFHEFSEKTADECQEFKEASKFQSPDPRIIDRECSKRSKYGEIKEAMPNLQEAKDISKVRIMTECRNNFPCDTLEMKEENSVTTNQMVDRQIVKDSIKNNADFCTKKLLTSIADHPQESEIIFQQNKCNCPSESLRKGIRNQTDSLTSVRCNDCCRLADSTTYVTYSRGGCHDISTSVETSVYSCDPRTSVCDKYQEPSDSQNCKTISKSDGNVVCFQVTFPGISRQNPLEPMSVHFDSALEQNKTAEGISDAVKKCSTAYHQHFGVERPSAQSVDNFQFGLVNLDFCSYKEMSLRGSPHRSPDIHEFSDRENEENHVHCGGSTIQPPVETWASGSENVFKTEPSRHKPQRPVQACDQEKKNKQEDSVVCTQVATPSFFRGGGDSLSIKSSLSDPCLLFNRSHPVSRRSSILPQRKVKATSSEKLNPHFNSCVGMSCSQKNFVFLPAEINTCEDDSMTVKFVSVFLFVIMMFYIISVRWKPNIESILQKYC